MTEVDDALLDALMADMARVAKVEVLPRFQAIASDSARAKTAPDDLVTDADIAAEKALGTALVTRLPGIVLVGEEAVSADKTILDRIADADLCAIIDPVDGTWNFAHGIPVFGMILAITAKGRTIAGVIHYPVTGDFVVARAGHGAWHVAADGARQRLCVSVASSISEMTGFITMNVLPADLRAKIASNSLKFRNVLNWRCSAFEYRLLATGAVDFTMTASLMPWDHAAGALIHSEAGGYSAMLDGSPYVPSRRKGHLLLAPDVKSWSECRAGLCDEQVDEILTAG
ncbi:inositol monophosphatase family protein [Falsirhodobacter sp. 1013]|uniref:inositol monophosphatase family protein n=1 Tax=Falsirhodobacter sp. 1013 TaxID=3417566 RepID=UPI003EBDE314